MERRNFVKIMAAAGVAGACGPSLFACQTVEPSQPETPYDFYLECTTQAQLEELARQPFVQAVFPFSLMSFLRIAKWWDYELAILVTESFDNLDCSSFDRASLVEENTVILNDATKNPIIISKEFADEEGLNVGDSLTQETRRSTDPLTFTVGAIYKHAGLFANFDAVALCTSQFRKTFDGVVAQMGYSSAYLKASDLPALTAYLRDEFIPELEGNPSMSREEAATYVEPYAEHQVRTW